MDNQDAPASISGIAAVIIAVISSAVAAYVTYKKSRGESKKEDLAISVELEEKAIKIGGERVRTAIEQWRQYVKEREDQHRKDIKHLETELDSQKQEILELREKEMKCQLLAAEQRQRMLCLTEEIEKLKKEMVGHYDKKKDHPISDSQ